MRAPFDPIRGMVNMRTRIQRSNISLGSRARASSALAIAAVTAATLNIAAAPAAAQRRGGESASPPVALAPDQFDAQATVTVRQGADGQYEIRIGDASFRHARWVEIEKKAIELLPGRTITFVDPQGQTLHVSPRAMIGILLEPISGALASQLNLNPGEALVVTEVQDDLPAARAGLLVHDVIIECNGKRPMTNVQFSRIMAASVPGDTVNIVLFRKGRETEVEVRVERYSPEAMASVRKPLGTGLSPADVLQWLAEAGEDLPEGIAVPHNGERQPVVSLVEPRVRGGEISSEALRAELDGIRRQLRRIEEVLKDLLLLEQQRQAEAARAVGG